MAPSLRDVVERRIETYPKVLIRNELVEIDYGGGKVFTPGDVEVALRYITGLALQKSS
ncbi:unnamed protein product, partial [marine sediment metagenome]